MTAYITIAPRTTKGAQRIALRGALGTTTKSNDDAGIGWRCDAKDAGDTDDARLIGDTDMAEISADTPTTLSHLQNFFGGPFHGQTVGSPNADTLISPHLGYRDEQVFSGKEVIWASDSKMVLAVVWQ